MHGGRDHHHRGGDNPADDQLKKMCCPNPDEQQINQHSYPYIAKAQQRMKWLYYGQWVYLFCEFLLRKSILAAFFGLIQVWIFYQAYATASFCQTIFCVVILIMNAIQVGPFAFNEQVADFYRMLCGFMLIYNIVGVVWSYQAFQVFKQAYNDLMTGVYGGAGGGSSQSFLYQQPQDNNQ